MSAEKRNNELNAAVEDSGHTIEETQSLKKIGQMYAQSLVTVFEECIIANLTNDYYVNCRKDILWTEFPVQGNFDRDNSAFAQGILHPDDVTQFNQCFSREAMLRSFDEGKNQITRRLRRQTDDGGFHMTEFTAVEIKEPGEPEKLKEAGRDGGDRKAGSKRKDPSERWCVLVFRDIHEEYLLEQKRDMEISQLAIAAQIAYDMLIAVNLTENTYHMLEYERFPIKKPVDAGCFDDLIEFELTTVHPDHREEFVNKFSRIALTEAFLRGERIVTMEVPHFGTDGKYHWNFTQVVYVKGSDTDDLIEITLSRNIDEDRRLREEVLNKERQAKQLLEEALQKAEEASRAKSDFLSKMSHDIRTPINAIVGMTELAQLHMDEPDRLKDYLEKVQSSGVHLLGLINEILDVSKIESGTVELEEAEFDLRSFMENVVEMVRLSLEGRKQLLTLEVDSDLHSQVLGDARRLMQVLVNILENASKYTPEGGRISFALEEVKKGERQVGTYRFTISDTGVGMKPEYLQHIFEPFSRADDSRTSKVVGTGLGMTIVQNLVSMMGGEIQVKSEYGKGSKFFVTLCLMKCDGAAEPSPEVPLEAEEAFPELRVLLVEDNEINRQIAVEMLEVLGARVETSENGRQAVEAVCSHPPFYYDVVFMDIQMPILNGYDAVREIRNCGMEAIDELPILAMTADAFAEDANKARIAGMNGHLAKPISIGQLRSALAECVGWKRKNQR